MGSKVFLASKCFFDFMQEIEVKILEIDRQKVVKTLTGLGAEKVFDGEVLTLFFDFQDGQIHKRKDVLRLRKEQDNVELTYKKIQAGGTVKVAEESSVQVSDLETTLKILQNLGLSVTQKMQKHRISFKLGSVRFDIDRYSDEYAFIPEFLEIEGPLDCIRKYAEILGFREKDCLPWSTDELIRHYSAKEKQKS